MKRLHLEVLTLVIAATIILMGPKGQEAFAEEYVLGHIADITGKASTNYLGHVEAFRIYMERLNDKGGINGRKVRVLWEDDRSIGTRSAAAATKLVEEGATMLFHASMSATYEASKPVAIKAGIPWVAAGVPDRAAMPPDPHPLIFCNRMMGDAVMGTKFMHYAAKLLSEKIGPAPLRLMEADVEMPVAAQIQKASPNLDAEMGVNTVGMMFVPMSTTDFSPLAARIMESGANWTAGYMPSFLHAGLFKKLISRGYKGKYIPDPGSGWEYIIKSFNSPQYLPPSDKALFIDDLPIHREIREAAKKYKSGENPDRFSYGWVMGMWVEAALRQVGWPYTSRDLLEVLNHLEVNFDGLMYPIKFTPHDHHGPTAYRIYALDKKRQSIVPLTDWYRIDADTLKLTDIGTSLPR